MDVSMAEIELDPEEKKKRIDRLMEHTKEEIATQWVMVGTNMKEDYDKLKMEFIEYKMANDISRFFEDVRSEQSNGVLGSKIRSAIQSNSFYIDWLKKQESKAKLIIKIIFFKNSISLFPGLVSFFYLAIWNLFFLNRTPSPVYYFVPIWTQLIERKFFFFRCTIQFNWNCN